MGALPDKVGLVRAFLRTLNLVLKAVRMYGFDHVRTAEGLAAAWKDLRSVIEAEGSLKIAVSGAKLLIDGNPLKANPAETAFAQMLAAAGISSLHFLAQVTEPEFGRFVRAFAQAGGKFEGLLDHLREAVGASGGIRVNEVRFVEADAEAVVGTTEARVVGEFAAQALGAEAATLREAVTNPRKLLTLIAAAQGAAETAGAGAGQPTEAELAEGVAFLAKLSEARSKAANPAVVTELLERVRTLSPGTQNSLRLALTSLLDENSTAATNPQLLLQLAERMAIQQAIRKFEQGDARVDAVRDVMSRMAREIETLRKKLAVHEELARQATPGQADATEILERDFWSALSYDARRRALMSPDAWTLPVKYARLFLEEARAHNDAAAEEEFLFHYAAGVRARKGEIRRAAADGILDLIEFYRRAPGGVLESAIAQTGEQLSEESDPSLQTTLGNVFVRLSHLAADTKNFDAMKQVFVCLRLLIHRQPALAVSLGPRVGMENRVAELVELALATPQVPASLGEVLKEMPRATILYVAQQFSQATMRDRAERLVRLAESLGPEAVQSLAEVLRTAPDSEAIPTVGLLTRLEIGAVAELLRARLPRWSHTYQNLVVRQVASSGAAGRGRLLEHLFDLLDPLVWPPAIDEIGISGEVSAAPRLLRLAGGEIPPGGSPYLTLKAVEALGRLRVPEAAPILKKYVEEKRLWMWAHPRELRVVALQALQKLEPDWAEKFLPESGIPPAELALAPLEPTAQTPGVRQRCYARVPLRRLMSAHFAAGTQEFTLTLKDLSLGGALATGEARLPTGTRAVMTIGSGSTAIQATTLVRGTRKNGISFEIVDIDFEARSRLRKLLLEIQR
jgi:hypothetical protein